MLVTSIVCDYGVKKEKHFQKDTNMKIHIFIPFKNIFKLKIYLGRMRQLMDLKLVYLISVVMLLLSLEFNIWQHFFFGKGF
jgi:hypothetical protein